jgi:hypothetical protein
MANYLEGVKFAEAHKYQLKTRTSRESLIRSHKLFWCLFCDTDTFLAGFYDYCNYYTIVLKQLESAK